MTTENQLKFLRIALVLVGVIFIAGVYLLMIIWPSGWTWHTGHSDYPMMIVGIYATLGVFLILAARNPLDHLSLIWFTFGRASCMRGSWPSSHSKMSRVAGIFWETCPRC